jgi:hypothetical protein
MHDSILLGNFYLVSCPAIGLFREKCSKKLLEGIGPNKPTPQTRYTYPALNDQVIVRFLIKAAPQNSNLCRMDHLESGGDQAKVQLSSLVDKSHCGESDRHPQSSSLLDR